MKISVIIPVYNTEKYLAECLDSVFNQDFDDFEVICVNDGSTDSSLEILEKYAIKYKNLKILSQKNSGAGYSRKVGLDIAQGRYILFMDADDAYLRGAFEKLYQNIENNNSDVASMICNCWNSETGEETENSGTNLIPFFPKNTDFNNFTFTHKDIKDILLGSAWCVPCNKIYRKSFLDEYDFYFPKHIRMEDNPFTLQIALKAEKMSFLPISLYKYRISNRSVMRSVRNKLFFESVLSIIPEMKKILLEEKVFEEYKHIFYRYVIAIIDCQLYSQEAEDDLKSLFYDKIKECLKQIDIKLVENQYFIDIYNNFLQANTYKEYKLIKKIMEIECLKNEIENYKIEIKVLQKAIEEHQKTISELQKSWSFRIGRAITKTISAPVELFRKIGH